MECWVCRSLSGEQRISPGPTIYEGRYWVVEHAYPTALKGWLVIVLKRHAEALHELSAAEFAELAALQAQATRILFTALHCQKEYVACYAESEHFCHLHFHVVPKQAEWPDSLKGTKSFTLLNVTAAEAVPPAEIKAFCERLREQFTL